MHGFVNYRHKLAIIGDFSGYTSKPLLISVTEDDGINHSPDAVFYGGCDDPAQNWSITFPDSFGEDGKPLLLPLVKAGDQVKSDANKIMI